MCFRFVNFFHFSQFYIEVSHGYRTCTHDRRRVISLYGCWPCTTMVHEGVMTQSQSDKGEEEEEQQKEEEYMEE